MSDQNQLPGFAEIAVVKTERNAAIIMIILLLVIMMLSCWAVWDMHQRNAVLQQQIAELKANAGSWVELESLSGEYRLDNHFTQGFVQEITAKGEFGRKIAVHNWHGKIPEHFTVKDGKIIECK